MGDLGHGNSRCLESARHRCGFRTDALYRRRDRALARVRPCLRAWRQGCSCPRNRKNPLRNRASRAVILILILKNMRPGSQRLPGRLTFRHPSIYNAPMQAVILAAGRGTRMGTLTENLPKPLLEVGGKTLLEHKLDMLPYD